MLGTDFFVCNKLLRKILAWVTCMPQLCKVTAYVKPQVALVKSFEMVGLRNRKSMHNFVARKCAVRTCHTFCRNLVIRKEECQR